MGATRRGALPRTMRVVFCVQTSGEETDERGSKVYLHRTTVVDDDSALVFSVAWLTIRRRAMVILSVLPCTGIISSCRRILVEMNDSDVGRGSSPRPFALCQLPRGDAHSCQRQCTRCRVFSEEADSFVSVQSKRRQPSKSIAFSWESTTSCIVEKVRKTKRRYASQWRCCLKNW